MKLLQHALAYHKLGWSIVPIIKGSKRPAVRWESYQSRRADPEQLTEWFHGTTYSGLAVVLGRVSGRLACRDFDKPGAYEEWQDENFELACHLPTVRTARGAHVYFLLPEDSSITGTQRYTDGELRADGGIVLLPPSAHPSGVHYEWIIGITDHRIDAAGDNCGFNGMACGVLKEVDPEEAGLCAKGTHRLPEGQSHTPDVPGVITAGSRNSTLTSLAGTLRRRGLNQGEILGTLRQVNSSRCTPPLEEGDLATIADSVCRYAPEAGQDIGSQQYSLNDDGNSLRFVAEWKSDMRYVPAWKHWVYYDGRLWVRDEMFLAEHRFVECMRRIELEAAQCKDAERAKLLKSHSKASGNEHRVRSGLKLATSEPDICQKAGDFDSDPFLIVAGRDTLRLPSRRGERVAIVPNSREHYITRAANVVYEPSAKCPVWEQFLEDTFCGRRRLIEFVQRMAGYTLTGSTREHAMFILHGTGRNGKSTLVETFSSILGELARHTPMDTFVGKQGGSIPNDIARLQGCRIAIAAETEQGSRLREATIKQLTGGDRIAARFLYGEFFEFNPQFKIYLVCNHKPKITGGDHAIWARVKLIPFDFTVPPEKVNHELPELLMEEASGIFNWMLTGCEMWADSGLGTCEEVEYATGKYSDEMDVLKQFVEDEVELVEGGEIGSAALYERYVQWTRANGEFTLSQKMFSARMEERGYEKRRTKRGMSWIGMQLSSKMFYPSGMEE